MRNQLHFVVSWKKNIILKKTVKKVQDKFCVVISAQKNILKKEKFKIFTTVCSNQRDCIIENYNPKEEIAHANLKCIPKIQLGQKISATELGAVLKK